MCHSRIAQGWEHDRHQAIVGAILVGQQCGEHTIRKTARVGSSLDCNRPEILACRPKDISDRAVAVVDAVDHRFGKVHEPPHQIQRQVGARLGNAVNDHRPLQVEILHEVPPLLPIDERPCGL